MTPKAFDSIAALLEALNGESQRERTALSFYRGRTLVGRMSSGELAKKAEELAGYLTGALKIKPGDRVLVLSPNRLEIPVLLLAIMRVGAVAVPLNPTTPAEDWAYIARHSEARGVFTTRELGSRLAAVHAGFEFTLALEDFDTFKGPKLPALPGLDHELAIVLYTSGTTGNPKGVGLSQSNLLRNGWSMAVNFKLERTTQFAVLPLYHAHALGFGLMTSLTTGGHLVFAEKLDPFAWVEVIRTENASYTSVVPSMLPMLLAARVHRDKVPSLRSMLVSSAPLTATAAREFESTTGITLVQGWGLSEYTNFACCLPVDLDAAEHEALLYAADGTSIGSPLTGTEVMVADLEGRPLGPGEPGELCVRGHSRMIAYFRDPEATRATMREDWLRTGDQGLYREHQGKRVFFVTGRIREIIIRGGEKYSPLAIERKLFSILPELEGKLVVVGYAHRAHGEEIGAYLEAESVSEELRARLMRAAESLPVETRPKVILYSKAPVPRTHTGKIQRRKLQPLFARYVESRGPLRIETVGT